MDNALKEGMIASDWLLYVVFLLLSMVLGWFLGVWLKGLLAYAFMVLSLGIKVKERKIILILYLVAWTLA